MNLKTTDRMKCPHCCAELEGDASEYVVPWQPPGPKSQALDTCPHCYAEFTAEQVDADTVKVKQF